MRKFSLFLLAILLPMVANAYDVCIGDIYYNIVSKTKTAEVTYGENKYQGEITVPADFEFDGITYTVTGIGNDAFNGCRYMTKIELPSSITILGDQAFYGCKFSEINIPQNVVSIGKYCFKGCEFKSVTIPASVKALKLGAFKDCIYLADVFIDGYIENIDDNVFLFCEALTAVHIQDIAKWCKNSFLDGWSNPLYYAKHLYINNEEVKDLVIPNSVEELGMQVFAYCTGLKSVVIPSTIKTIPVAAFGGCTGIESLDISDGVETIERGAFGACTGLTNVHIPNSVTSISGFNDCSNLAKIYIGKNVSEINNNAFAYCKNLSDFYCYSKKVPETASDTFQESYIEYSTLHVPESAVNAYKAAEPWKNFKSIIKIDMPKYNLSYSVDGQIYKTYQLEEGETITPDPEPTKEGYTFSGWSDIPETMPAEDLTIIGTFIINKYNLTYNVDGVEYKSSEVEYGKAITPETAPTKEGYTFSGWSEIPETMPAHDVTVTGTFAINQYTITYKIDDEVYQTESVDYGSTITPPNAPEREGYTFKWIDVPETMPAHDITIVGSYASGINAIRMEAENGKVFDLNGHHVKTPGKGVYIINGQKVVIM